MSLMLQALSCFRTSSAFVSDVDGMYMNRRERPVLQVIVTQTRERYEDDMAFEEIEEQRGLREMLGRRPSGMIHNGYVYSKICVCIHIVEA
ncbi:hypothetical protein DEU56DRAFT_820586, partial [Suillus clintonianus]|uniref:uncharacterized protein n=1 Tax=Suillus clintonianus TaxID=1904413 RepID=UPI001B863D92